ncbi:hypothetical protein PCASD_03799 [Puccinia coronata f. sp. avenae]|uniref:Uncharacterized protein n=1 Tax=Puccinia coronata f. sp. avenae TaxID=200324 RepID=A0A2N5V8H9_9BASI|nr:hypothetical protein PCASD_03799 [Puccinia coronata f. sp. avenae]
MPAPPPTGPPKSSERSRGRTDDLSLPMGDDCYLYRRRAPYHWAMRPVDVIETKARYSSNSNTAVDGDTVYQK